MPYKVIYTCGDSHTAGGELADDLLWPDQHPGFYSEDEIALRDMRALMRWRDFRERSIRRGDPVDWTGWQLAENQQAWPAKLAGLLNCEVINAARIGSSTEWICRQTIDDVSALLNSYGAGDICVLLQPSTYLRMQMHDPQIGWTSFQMADAYGMDEHVHRWFNEHETDASLAARWMLSIIGVLGYLCKVGVRCILVDSSHNPIAKPLEQQQSLASLRSAYDIMSRDAWHVQSMEDAARDVHHRYCPDLHWSRQVHANFARDIASILL